MLGIFNSDLPAPMTAEFFSSSSSASAAALHRASNSVTQSQISAAFRNNYVAAFDALPIKLELRRIARDFASSRGLLKPGTLACHIRTGLADTWHQDRKRSVRRLHQ